MQLQSLVQRLPQGLDTPIGKKGAQLSGGERQRLALTRLLFQQDARIFILDEATSAMDTITEHKVMQALHGRTVVLIAHRLTTLRDADRIHLMRGGMLCGQGTFEELRQNNPYFQSLLKVAAAS